jgi:putative membrane protein
MDAFARAVTLFVAFAHLGFMVLETLLWTAPIGRKIFRQTPETAEITRVLALNQGMYNAGVAVLLAWAALTHRAATVDALLLFVVAMGIVGAVTVKPRILVVQSLPAAIALALWHL